MSRPISFRIWNHQTSMFDPAKSLKQLHDPNIDVVQFTGLHDQAGNEIWEEDIIRLVCTDDMFMDEASIVHYRVCFWRGGFGTLSEDGSEFMSFSQDYPPSGEVIGNRLANTERWRGRFRLPDEVSR